MITINIKNGKKIFSSNSEELKDSFLNKFYSLDKTRCSKKLIKFMFYNIIEDKLGYLNSLNFEEIKNHTCIFDKAFERDEIEIVTFFIKKGFGKNREYNCKFRSIEMLEYLESVNMFRYTERVTINLIKNNLVDIILYFLDRDFTIYGSNILKNILVLDRIDLLEIIFSSREGMIENIINHFGRSEIINNGIIDSLSDNIIDFLFEKKILEMDKFNKFNISNIKNLHKFAAQGLLNKVSYRSEVFSDFRILKKYQYDYDLRKIILKDDSSRTLIYYAACDTFLVDVETVIGYIKIYRGYLERYNDPLEFRDVIDGIILKYSEEDRQKIIDFYENL